MRQDDQKGFTLLETIMYFALFSILMTGIITSVYSLMESGDRNQTKAMLQEEKEYLLGKINFALSGVKTVSTPAAGASATSLFATRYGGSTVLMGLSGTDMVYEGAVLNNSNIKVSNLVFIHAYAGGGNPESVEAGFTLSATMQNGMTITQTASTTRYIRK